MSDHIPNVTKMISDFPISDSTPHNVADLGMLCRKLERQLNAAKSKIELLMSANADVARIAGERDAAEKLIRLLIAERDTARMQADQKVSLREEFRELLGTDDIEQGITVVCDLKQLAAVRLGYIKQLEEQLMDAKNKHSVLVADVVLNEDRAERIKRLEKALDTLTLVVGLTPITGNKDALQEAMDMARSELKAKEAKP